MSVYTVPDAAVQRILARNGMDPNEYGVMQQSEDSLLLICYRSRDIIRIMKGDKEWPKSE